MQPPRTPAYLVAILAIVFLAVASGTMVNVALPFIGEAFGATEAEYGWVVSGFMLTFGVFSAVFGRLGDVFGVRRLYLIGAGSFFALALAAALAPNLPALIAIRIVQGSASAAIPALGTTIISRLLPPAQRGAAIGALVATVGVSASLSPFLGGALLTVGSWRLVMAFPVLGLLLLAPVLRALPASLNEVAPGARFDVTGATLLSVGAAALLVGTNLTEAYGFGPLTMGLFALGCSLLVSFAWWVGRTPTPFMPPQLLWHPGFAASALTGALVNGTRFGSLVLAPIMLKDGLQASPLVIGAALFPGALALAVLSPIAGRLADRVGAKRAAWPGVLGMLITSVATIWLIDWGVWGVTLALTASGAAFAFVQPPLLGGLSRVVPKHSLGVGNGLYLMVFFLGGAFGVAFALTVLASQPADAPAWLPGASDALGRYANTAAALVVPVLMAGLGWRWLPGLTGGSRARA